ARQARSRLRLRRTRRAARDCRVDGVAESPARSSARRDAAALAHTGDDGGGCPHDRCRDGGGRTLIYECRPAARARGARYRAAARRALTGLAVSNVALWLLPL